MSVKVALVGYGHLGRWHAQKVDALDSSELMYIVESFEKNALSAKSAHPNSNVVSSYENIIDEVDAFIIATPTSTHFEIARELVFKGKHVFVEKPVCETYEQACELKDIAKDKNIVVQVGHSERFHKAWELILNKSFFKGDSTIEIKRVAPFKGRATDVDVIQDLMIHDLDLLLYLFDESPVAVESTGYKIRTKYWDYVSSIFHFESGKKATITVGRNQVEEIRSVDIVNSEGHLKIDLMNGKILEALGKFEDTFVESADYEKRDHLYLEQERFYDSILSGVDPVVSIDDGIKALELIQKVQLSLEKKELVKIRE